MRLPTIDFDRSALANFDGAIKKEWLVTNGLGGYASSTVLGMNTKKYHGLLIAAVHPPKDRKVFLEKVDEDLISDGKVYRLGTNEFSDTIFPRGHDFLEQFTVSPFPAYTYSQGNVTIRKTIFMPYEMNCTIILYNISNKSASDIAIRFFPLVNWRNFHSVTKRSQAVAPSQEHLKHMVKVSFKDLMATLRLKVTEGHYFVTDKWTEKLFFREEASRGETCFDDCYQPGYFEATVERRSGKEIGMVATVDGQRAEKAIQKAPSTVSGLKSLNEQEVQRHQGFLEGFYGFHKIADPDDWLSWLVLAARSFIVRGSLEKERSVIAGYHWFGVWGRDTFVSLPGLMLATGKFDEAKQVLLTFANSMKDGLIPNFISDEDGSSVYNTVDATLWYVNAVLQYVKYTGDLEFVRQKLWNTLEQIIEKHFEGTLFGIRVDSDGLLSHGPQLTWMDSSVGGKPVAPRAGKAVEIQALWFNALKTMELLAIRYHDDHDAEKYGAAAEKAGKSFEKFWNLRKKCLYDVIVENGADDSLRPNQIFAVSLDFVMLDIEKSKSVVEIVRDKLLTPCGLRTLSRDDPRYVGVYVGDRSARDRAYHSGTVWPWLLGPFTTAYLKVKGRSNIQKEYAFDKCLKPLLTSRIYEAGCGTVSEIFDGDPPHTARGCISQAWSVAEPLRAYFEDVLEVRPPNETRVLKSLR
jgi:predicted glycogen debranching enzyme